MTSGKMARMAAILCGFAVLGGSGDSAAAFLRISPATLPAFPGPAPTAGIRHAGGAQLQTVQSGTRSYMEGRGFQSYQRDRGFGGSRQFGAYPDSRGDGGNDRLYGLQRPRTYGPSPNRCTGWSSRCDARWGGGNPDYYGCMRYHGCR